MTSAGFHGVLVEHKGEYFSDRPTDALRSSGLHCVRSRERLFGHSVVFCRRRLRALANQFFSYKNNNKHGNILFVLLQVDYLYIYK